MDKNDNYAEELLESYIKVDPHIESNVRLLKKQYNTICDMITIRVVSDGMMKRNA